MITMLQSRIRTLFFLGGFLVPPVAVEGWGTCSYTRDYNNLNIGRRPVASRPPTRLMAADKNNDASAASEEKDNNDRDNDHDEKASRQHRLAKAQAEIDRILNNPVDPPFDFESEMKKVASISPPLIQEGSAEFQLEESVAEVEEQLKFKWLKKISNLQLQITIPYLCPVRDIKNRLLQSSNSLILEFKVLQNAFKIKKNRA